MEKIKIKKIMAFWLAGMTLLVSIQMSVFFVTRSKAEVVGGSPVLTDKPAVLGDAIDLRGEQITSTVSRSPVKTGELDVKNISAKSFLVYDAESGDILAEKNGNVRYPIASLTKLLTALVAYDEIDLNLYYKIVANDKLDISPALYLRLNDTIQGWDLFNSMLVGSANDAAKTLARLVAEKSGKNITVLMNEKAVALGMTDSRFSNALGFDSQYNYSTANDLKKLVERTQELPAFTKLGKKTSYLFNSQDGVVYRVPATNKLVGSVSEVEAVKTGYTENSKGAMISKITRDGHKIVVIVLASLERENDTLRLSEEVFKAFEWQ